MSPSARQAAIYDCWENEETNMVVGAVAGSGKTTVLMQLLEMCDSRVLFLAFNKSIQTEIQDRIDKGGIEQGKAMTLHSLGFMALRAVYSYVKVHNGKKYKMMKIVEKMNIQLFKSLKWEKKSQLYYTLYDLHDFARIYMTDDLEELKMQLIGAGKNFFECKELPIIWKDWLKVREEGYVGPKIDIDFIDMIYLPAVKDIEIPINTTYLMVDEAQDLNLCQHKIIDKLIAQGVERWVAVGDPHQAIYGFSGASTKSFSMFLDKENAVEMPLDICYRCPVSVLEYANEVYDIMEGFKTDEGEVSVVEDWKEIKDGSMVICRNTGPIISLYFKMIAAKRKVFIKGDDIINAILGFIRPFKYKTISQTMSLMTAELTKLQAKTKESDKIKAYFYDQNFTNFRVLSNHLVNFDDKVEVLIQAVQNIFAQEEEGTILCTIHKSKGLEADNVYILNQSLIPSKFATTEEQLAQEMNLKYVARTRAKEATYLLNLD